MHPILAILSLRQPLNPLASLPTRPPVQQVAMIYGVNFPTIFRMEISQNGAEGWNLDNTVYEKKGVRQGQRMCAKGTTRSSMHA